MAIVIVDSVFVAFLPALISIYLKFSPLKIIVYGEVSIRVVLHNDRHFYKGGICKCLRGDFNSNDQFFLVYLCLTMH